MLSSLLGGMTQQMVGQATGMLTGQSAGGGGLINGLQGQVSGAATGLVNSLTGGLTGQVQGFVQGLVGGILSGPTGAAGVNFENERKVGDSRFHNSKITGKWRDMDYVLKQMGRGGLQSFGWGNGKVPSSASGNFKKAEDAFFSVLKGYLDKVIQGQLQFPQTFEDDTVIMNYLMQNMPASTPIQNTPKPDVVSQAIKTTTNQLSKADSVKGTKTEPKKTGSIPWWLAIPFLI